jgi:hypothetical protein
MARGFGIVRKPRETILFLCVGGYLPAALASQTFPEQSSDWRADWAVHGNLSLAEDSREYRFPTAIAFVPRPGPSRPRRHE